MEYGQSVMIGDRGYYPVHKLLRDRQDTNEDCNIIAKWRNRDNIEIDHASQISRSARG